MRALYALSRRGPLGASRNGCARTPVAGCALRGGGGTSPRASRCHVVNSLADGASHGRAPPPPRPPPLPPPWRRKNNGARTMDSCLHNGSTASSAGVLFEKFTGAVKSLYPPCEVRKQVTQSVTRRSSIQKTSDITRVSLRTSEMVVENTVMKWELRSLIPVYH